jgi:hypothetical protein
MYTTVYHVSGLFDGPGLNAKQNAKRSLVQGPVAAGWVDFVKNGEYEGTELPDGVDDEQVFGSTHNLDERDVVVYAFDAHTKPGDVLHE